jgi:hypothetical protein
MTATRRPMAVRILVTVGLVILGAVAALGVLALGRDGLVQYRYTEDA